MVRKQYRRIATACTKDSRQVECTELVKTFKRAWLKDKLMRWTTKRMCGQFIRDMSQTKD